MSTKPKQPVKLNKVYKKTEDNSKKLKKFLDKKQTSSRSV